MAEFENKLRYLMLFRKLLQHILSRGNRFAFAPARRSRQTQMSEEHLTKLLGRIDVKSPPRQFEDAFAHPLKLHTEAL